MDEFKFVVTAEEYEMIYKGLLELPGKFGISLILKLDTQFSYQVKEKLKSEEDKRQLEIEFKKEENNG